MARTPQLERLLLGLAASTGDTAIATILLARHTDANTIGYLGETPLYWAAKYGHVGTVKLLLAHKAKANFRNNSGESPLGVAASRAMAELLLTDSIDVHDKYRALCTAAEWGRKDVVDFLLTKETPISGKAADGWTPLCRAAYGGHKDIVEFLLAHGAEVNPKNGETPPLGPAIFGCSKDAETEPGKPGIFASPAEHREIVELLVARGADCRMMMAEAAISGQKWIVELMLANQAEVNLRDSNGNTPLMRAAQEGYMDIVELLRQHGGK